jgi:enoyl-CoA hydratase
MTFDNLLVERDDAVARVTINRPKVLNALNRQTLDELQALFLELQHDAAVRAVVLTGAGERSFVAGADIHELSTLTPVAARELARLGQDVFNRVERLGKPVVAAINGFALGGGCELAMACTIRIASENARLGQPEISLGLLPGYAGTQRLPRLIGKGRALEMMLTGAPVSAAEAAAIGLVNRVVPASELLPEASRLAAQLAAQPRQAVALILDAVNSGVEMPFADACAFEASLFGLAVATDDMREGTRAFLDKRKAQFTHK